MEKIQKAFHQAIKKFGCPDAISTDSNTVYQFSNFLVLDNGKLTKVNPFSNMRVLN